METPLSKRNPGTPKAGPYLEAQGSYNQIITVLVIRL